ncbi:MAG: DUF1501 domain-containing protein [Verrucomicrobiales bacterium]
MIPPDHKFPVASRREFLGRLGGGFGGVALAGLLHRDGSLATAADSTGRPLPHFAPRARRVIQLFMNGGASPMDTFDYKPELEKRHGEMLGPKEKPEGQTGMSGAVMKSPFEFRQHGQCGRWVSRVFPHQAKWVDHMAFLIAMRSKTNVHGPASFMMNTGFLLPGFPSCGAWVSYALGSLSDNLPTFVVLPDARGLPYNQKGNFTAGFLPARHQGTVLAAAATPPVPDLVAPEKFTFARGAADEATWSLLGRINRAHAAAHPGDSRLEARIVSGELAAQMQLSAPEVFDLNRESETTRSAYGLDAPVTADFGRRCLLARRLIERGTRFVQVWSGPQGATSNWDNHGSIINELPPIAASVDLPIAALLADLHQRGLLEDTLVVWTTEFGRTPFAQNGQGRDHNGGSFVTWLAGAGIKPGVSHGQSDDFGGQAVDGVTYCYDLHATMLHLLGLDHERLSFRHSGVDRRLTDVHGHVVHDILA